ncbi:hypothetical protein BDV06DRAFT_233764 [Aspergillus oleicola]
MEAPYLHKPDWHKIEEETLQDYVPSHYHPTRMGEVIKEPYQVISKLGFGSTSTAWLARNLSSRRYVTLKIYLQSSQMGQQTDHELKLYKLMAQHASHPGHDAVRTLHDAFHIDGPEDKHRCLVHPPLLENVLTFLRRNPVERLPSAVLAYVLYRVFMVLDYLHTECYLVHTDLKTDNVMLGIKASSVYDYLEKAELEDLTPKKEYREEFVQSNIYWVPEVIPGIPWTYSIDIRNVGCMIWDIYEGGRLFRGYDPELERYQSRAHLAEIINLLRLSPPGFIAQGRRKDEFFSGEGRFLFENLLTGQILLEEREMTLEGEEEREAFLRLMRKMLQWEPSK